MTRQTNNESPNIPVNADFISVYEAWQQARKHKRPSSGQLFFESNWLQGISGLGHLLRSGRWRPRRAVCFIVNHPKVREIHAPDFVDRILHHWLVPKLESIYEPHFIYDSYANRRGKGSHAAVIRLQQFMRQVIDGQGAGKGWFLQLDIRDYFYSIHKPTLYRMLKQALQKESKASRAKKIDSIEEYMGLQSLCHKLLVMPVNAIDLPSARRKFFPARKRLCFAAPASGLPIGNLSSQFFANVYLDALDQFVKHQLKVRHYLRYMDDFILLATDQVQLKNWHKEITTFLSQNLRLELKPAQAQLLKNGVDFLGYRIYPHHKVVRPRVIKHCRKKLRCWQRDQIVRDGDYCRITADKPALEILHSTLASYLGHFGHADSQRLIGRLLGEFNWLVILFDEKALTRGILQPRWLNKQVVSLHEQLRALRGEYPQAWIAAVCGYRYWVLVPHSPVRRGRLFRGVLPALWHHQCACLQQDKQEWLELNETGYLRHGARLRSVCCWYVKWPKIKEWHGE